MKAIQLGIALALLVLALVVALQLRNGNIFSQLDQENTGMEKMDSDLHQEIEAHKQDISERLRNNRLR